MPSRKMSQNNPDENAENQWKNIYTLGGITALIVIAGTLLDIIVGTVLGGDLSSIPLIVYLILVTFVPAVETAAMMIAAHGGLLSLAWMIMFTIRLFKLGRAE